MHLSIAVLFAASLAASLTTAYVIKRDGLGLEECSRNCAEAAAMSSNIYYLCGEDAACMCKNPDYTFTYFQCAATQCDHRVGGELTHEIEAACRYFGVTISGPSATASATSDVATADSSPTAIPSATDSDAARVATSTAAPTSSVALGGH